MMPGDCIVERLHEDRLSEPAERQIEEPCVVDRGHDLVSQWAQESGNDGAVGEEQLAGGVGESLLLHDHFLEHIPAFSAGLSSGAAIGKCPPGLLEARRHLAMRVIGSLKFTGRCGESGLERGEVTLCSRPSLLQPGPPATGGRCSIPRLVDNCGGGGCAGGRRVGCRFQPQVAVSQIFCARHSLRQRGPCRGCGVVGTGGGLLTRREVGLDRGPGLIDAGHSRLRRLGVAGGLSSLPNRPQERVACTADLCLEVIAARPLHSLGRYRGGLPLGSGRRLGPQGREPWLEGLSRSGQLG